jgi:hypothetical protein
MTLNLFPIAQDMPPMPPTSTQNKLGAASGIPYKDRMSNNPNPGMLDGLREQFARLNIKLDHIGADVTNLKGRVSTLEADGEHTRIALAEVNAGLDRVDNRLERIEVRLDLVDQPAG